MADDKTKPAPQDSSRINVNEDYELRYWMKVLEVSEGQLREAVKAVGVSTDKVHVCVIVALPLRLMRRAYARQAATEGVRGIFDTLIGMRAYPSAFGEWDPWRARRCPARLRRCVSYPGRIVRRVGAPLRFSTERTPSARRLLCNP
jgi:hypothetical protein